MHAGDLLDQLDWQWRTALRPCMAGLTDEAYLWEPVPGCWTIRPSGKMDWSFTPPDPPPFTTIAWRWAHICAGMAERASRQFGDASWHPWEHTYPTAVAGALAFGDECYEAWTGPVSRLTDEELTRPIGPANGPFADSPMSALILHISREVLHHGAEVCLLRDLHRATVGG